MSKMLYFAFVYPTYSAVLKFKSYQ